MQGLGHGVRMEAGVQSVHLRVTAPCQTAWRQGVGRLALASQAWARSSLTLWPSSTCGRSKRPAICWQCWKNRKTDDIYSIILASALPCRLRVRLPSDGLLAGRCSQTCVALFPG